MSALMPAPHNPLDTHVCSGCGHVRWRHVFHSAIRGCLVPGCECKAHNVLFAPAVGPQIEEFVSGDGKGRVPVVQPLPPHPAYRIDNSKDPYPGQSPRCFPKGHA